MSLKVNRYGACCSDVIKTQHVYSEKSQVFIKKEIRGETQTEEEWFPINFQWIPVMELRELLSQS